MIAGKWWLIDAPVTCRTAPGEYDVPVIPVIVNSGGTLFHLSEGKVVATLHRVNTTKIPKGRPGYLFHTLIPKMTASLIPFFTEGEDTGLNEDRDRGTNAVSKSLTCSLSARVFGGKRSLTPSRINGWQKWRARQVAHTSSC